MSFTIGAASVESWADLFKIWIFPEPTSFPLVSAESLDRLSVW